MHFVGIGEGNTCESRGFSMKLTKGEEEKNGGLDTFFFFFFELDQPEISKDFWATSECPLQRSKHTSQKANTSQGASCSF